jgi:ArsR family transcriptional regulator
LNPAQYLDLRSHVPADRATLSHHLKVLSDLGLITFRKEGLNVYYRVVSKRFAAYLRYLSEIGPKSRK